MRRPALPAIALALLALAVGTPASAQTVAERAFLRYQPTPALLDAASARPARDAAAPRRPGLDPGAWLGSAMGSGAGLIGGARLGLAVAEHTGADCCGDDPGIGFALLGAAAGTVLGNALGGEIGSRATGRPAVPFGRRLAAGVAGALAGGMAVHLGNRMGGLDDRGALVTYSAVSGLLSSVITGSSGRR